MLTGKKLLIGSLSMVVFLLGVNACTSKREPPLPQGPQTLTGALIPVPLSLDRRGSHLISVHGSDVYFAESTIVNLHDFERQEIGMTGTLERNIDPDALPVLVISAVYPKVTPKKSWEIKPLQLKLMAPIAWDMKTIEGGAQFSLSGSSMNVLTIQTSALTRLPAGNAVSIGGLRAVRIDAATTTDIHVQNGKMIVTFSFDPLSDDDMEEKTMFEQLLQSVTFTKAASSNSQQTTSGSPGGSPCGGAAGILCPSGQYCEITDGATGIGICRTIRR